jgi:uncharacterized zinc-type alcohol dehydrogenase-like protein
MCNKCDDINHTHDTPNMDRRKIIKGSAGAAAALVAAPLLAGTSRVLAAEGAVAPSELESVRAFGAASATSPLKQIVIKRRMPGPDDVVLDVLYAGICHSDVHQARDEWPKTAKTIYPVVPGHENIGRVIAVGKNVTKFKLGDIGGVGCMVDSCGMCENCLADREQNCLNGATFTYNTPDQSMGGLPTYGGYSDKLVVKEHFVVRIPPGVDLAATAPILCAGITTFSPIRHWNPKPGARVGVVGLGGLGHMALKLGVAHKLDMTVFTSSAGKAADAKRMGAKNAVLTTDAEAMKKFAATQDLVISTVPKAYPMQPVMDVLKLDATLVNVGAMNDLDGLNGMLLAFGRKNLAGSVIGGIAETQEVIDYCASRKITADIELIRPSQINEAYDRIVNKDIRYRFVIDMKAA